MAIVIPSKNIYEINNEKVRNNYIERIEVKATDITPRNDFKKSVYTEAITEFSPREEQKQFKAKGEGAKANDTYYQLSAVASVRPTYSMTKTIKFLVAKDNEAITKVYDKADKDGEPNIKVSVAGNKYTGTVSCETRHKLGNSFSNNMPFTITENDLDVTYSQPVYGEPYYEVFQNLSEKLTVSSGTGILGEEFKAEVKASNLSTNLSTLVVDMFIDSNPNLNYYYITLFTTLSGVERFWGYNERIMSYSEGIQYLREWQPFECEAEKYEPLKAEITFYGDTIGIDLKEGTVTIGQKSSTSLFSVDNNELIQTSNYIVENGNKVSMIDKAYSNTLAEYKDGKETATLLCSIDDYYNQDGTVAIDMSGDKMSFRMYDEVIPYVPNAQGVDIPMSLYKDGSPKVFKVISVHKRDRGVVWQEITLQEKMQSK